MGVFVNEQVKHFVGLNNNPTTLLTTDKYTVWITALTICNRGNTPMRFNSKLGRLSGTTLKKDAYASSTTNINATYNNGMTGVDATLTNAGTNATFSIDGTFPVKNSRVLIKDQTDATQNGIYCITVVGDNTTPWVLTRAFDYDSSDNIKSGDVIRINNGFINGGTIWDQTSVVNTVGTDPITFLSMITGFTQLTNEFDDRYGIKPYETKDIIASTGVITLQVSNTPFILDSLLCYSNGYSQVFDCTMTYLEIKELSTC